MQTKKEQEECSKCFEELAKISKSKYLYKYLDLEGGLKMLEHHNIQFTREDKLNDEYDCNWEIIKVPKDKEFIISHLKKNLKFGVCSLSISPNNSILWGDDYASSKGLCIGLDTDILMEFLVLNSFAQPPFIVKYVADIKKQISLKTLRDANNVNSFVEFFRIKDYERWRTEEEIRFVSLMPFNMCELNKRYTLPVECFKFVYIGNDLNDEQTKMVENVITEKGLDVKIIKL